MGRGGGGGLSLRANDRPGVVYCLLLVAPVHTWTYSRSIGRCSAETWKGLFIMSVCPIQTKVLPIRVMCV